MGVVQRARWKINLPKKTILPLPPHLFLCVNVIDRTEGFPEPIRKEMSQTFARCSPKWSLTDAGLQSTRTDIHPEHFT